MGKCTDFSSKVGRHDPEKPIAEKTVGAGFIPPLFRFSNHFRETKRGRHECLPYGVFWGAVILFWRTIIPNIKTLIQPTTNPTKNVSELRHIVSWFYPIPMLKYMIKKQTSHNKNIYFFVIGAYIMRTAKKVWNYAVIAWLALIASVNYELFVFPNQFAP